MRAIHLNDSSDALLAGEIPRPQPGRGEILARVHAAGATA